MPTTIVNNDGFQTGRSTVPRERLDYVSKSVNVDISTGAEIKFNFGAISSSEVFGVPRSIYVDNGTGPNPLTVNVSITGEKFTVPPYAQGYFPLNATDKSSIMITGDGGNSSKATITVYNHEKPSSVWYAPGNNNPLSADSVQGAMAEGSDVSTETSKNPVYIAGIDRATGLLHAFSVDATGILDVAIPGTITVTVSGAVTIDDSTPINVAVTNPVTIDSSSPISVAVANKDTLQGSYTLRSIASLSGSSEALMPSNANRRIMVIQNVSSNNMGVALDGGTAAIGTSNTLTLTAGERLVISDYPPVSSITVIGTAADTIVAYEG